MSAEQAEKPRKRRLKGEGEMVVTSMRQPRELIFEVQRKAAAEGTTFNYQITLALEALVGRRKP